MTLEKREIRNESSEHSEKTESSDLIDDGLSLEQINDAFSKLVESGADPYVEKLAEPDNWVQQTANELSEQVSEFQVTPIRIVEAFLFVGTEDNAPIMAEDMAKLMRGVRAEEIEELGDELNEEYIRDGNAFEIISEKGGFKMALKEEFANVRNKFYGKIKDAQLSQAAIDILSVIAYKQPVDRESIESLRGRSCGGILNQLVRRELISFERSSEKGQGRKKIYRTTDRFLEIFGLDSIDDLPSSQRLDFVD